MKVLIKVNGAYHLSTVANRLCSDFGLVVEAVDSREFTILGNIDSTKIGSLWKFRGIECMMDIRADQCR